MKVCRAFAVCLVLLVASGGVAVALDAVVERRGAGGNFSALGLGTRGFFLGGAGYYSPRAWIPPATDSSVSLPPNTGIAFSGDWRQATAGLDLIPPQPGSHARASAWFSMQEFNVTVTVAECTTVTFYLLDTSGERRVRLHYPLGIWDTGVFNTGVYATVVQSSASVTYRFQTTLADRNVLLNGVLLDPSSACTQFNPPEALTASSSSSSSPVPGVSSRVGGMEMLSGAGGDFRALGFGAQAYLLGGAYWTSERTSVPPEFNVTVDQSQNSPAWSIEPASAIDSDTRVLSVTSPRLTGRSASAWSNPVAVTITVRAPCRRVSFYVLDYDSTDRRLKVSVNGMLLGNLFTSFADGAYLSVNQTTTEATYVFLRTAGESAVVSGVFIDPLSEPDSCPGMELVADSHEAFLDDDARTSSSNYLCPAAAVNAAGQVAIAWGRGESIVARMFAYEPITHRLQPLTSSELRLNTVDASAGNNFRIATAIYPNGTAAVAWGSREGNLDGDDGAIMLRVGDLRCGSMTPEIVANQLWRDVQQCPKMILLPRSQRLVLTWVTRLDWDWQSTPQSISMRLFDGNRAISDQAVLAPLGDDHSIVAMPVGPHDKDELFLAVWQAWETTGDSDPTEIGMRGVRAQLFNATSLTAIGTKPVAVNQQMKDTQYVPAADARASDGRILIAWCDRLPQDGRPQYSIKYRVFDRHLVALTDEIHLASQVTGYSAYPKVTALDDGNFMLSYTQLSADYVTGDDSGSSTVAVVVSDMGVLLTPEVLVNEHAFDHQWLVVQLHVPSPDNTTYMVWYDQGYPSLMGRALTYRCNQNCGGPAAAAPPSPTSAVNCPATPPAPPASVPRVTVLQGQTAVQAGGAIDVATGFGGAFESLGFGRAGYFLGGAEALPGRASLSTGYRVVLSGAADAWTSLSAADSANPYLLYGAGVERLARGYQSYSGFTAVVTVPRCTRVTFYILDFDAQGRQEYIRPSSPDLGYRFASVGSFDTGTYVSFKQPAGTSQTYVFGSLRPSSSAAMSGIFFDDAAGDGCGTRTGTSAPVGGGRGQGASGGEPQLKLGEVVGVVVGVAVVCGTLAAVTSILVLRRSSSRRSALEEQEHLSPDAVMGHVVAPTPRAVMQPAAAAAAGCAAAEAAHPPLHEADDDATISKMGNYASATSSVTDERQR